MNSVAAMKIILANPPTGTRTGRCCVCPVVAHIAWLQAFACWNIREGSAATRAVNPAVDKKVYFKALKDQ